MPGFLRPYEPHTYALMRIMVGLLFFCHGASKLLGWPAPVPAGAPPFVLWIAGPIELIGGALVALGLFTNWAAFLSSGLMAFAYFLGHAKDGFIPMVNKGELAVVYCFVFLYMAARGSGIWSVDAARSSTPEKVTVHVRSPAGAR